MDTSPPEDSNPNGAQQPAQPAQVEGAACTAAAASSTNDNPPPTTKLDTPDPLSKNQQKKLRRQQAWEAKRDARRAGRKDKRAEQRARKRSAHAAAVADAVAAGLDPTTALAKPPRPPSTTVPVSIILDCSFDAYMMDKELKSLSSQVMRSYSENRNARHRAHLIVGSWGGRLRERFEVGMGGTQQFWKGVHFVEGDLGDAAAKARELMAGPRRGEEIDVLRPRGEDAPPAIYYETENGLPAPAAEEEGGGVRHKDVVYLSAESPYTLDRLEPGTAYVVGGLVDKNREKGLCYRVARERGYRTAKLPIGEYLVMASRRVLVTNHVVEIMLRWLECGDWGEAFLKVIPKRKGGTLRDSESADVEEGEEDEAEEGGGEDGAEEQGQGEVENVIETQKVAAS